MDAVTAMQMEGQEAPDFELPGSDGSVQLSALRGSVVVLFMYPRSFTGGCTAQACSLRDDHTALEERGVQIIGISTDAPDVQRRFKDEYSLPFPILADEDGKVALAYGVLETKTLDGVARLQARRVTFVIDEGGTIRRVIDPAETAAHAAEVIAVVDGLSRVASP